MTDRKAHALVELLLALAVVTLLLGLALSAVQQVRAAAATLKLKNQARQLALAVHAIEAERGKLPAAGNALPDPNSLPELLLAQLGYSAQYVRGPSTVFTPFVSSLDPSYAFYPDNWEGNSSFAFNSLVFETHGTASRVADGRSNTVMLAERYARCGDSASRGEWGVANSLHATIPVLVNIKGSAQIARMTPRPVTFADRRVDDILPVYDPSSRTSLPSTPGLTFQVAPRPDACDPRVVQAATRSGLVVAMMDGSVRTISPSVSPAVYWSSLTPDQGEVVSLD